MEEIPEDVEESDDDDDDIQTSMTSSEVKRQGIKSAGSSYKTSMETDLGSKTSVRSSSGGSSAYSYKTRRKMFAILRPPQPCCWLMLLLFSCFFGISQMFHLLFPGAYPLCHFKESIRQRFGSTTETTSDNILFTNVVFKCMTLRLFTFRIS